jgi:hypothetical protein
VSGNLTRRQLLKRAALAGAALSIPFVHRRYAHAAGGINPEAVRNFGTSLKGRLILPGDKDYDSARKLWNTRYDKHPAMIARCAGADDVRRAVEFARKNDLAASIRSGGHDPAGFSTNDGGIVIDLGSMNTIQVDPQHGRVSAGPGAHVGELYDALGKHGLAAVSGACPSVGIGGLTTGGGESWISNKYGTASDNVLDAQVVTADGRVLHSSPDENSDLFWAIRGGSGNFGVVTGFGLRTIPLTTVIKGSLAFPASRCRDVLRFCRGFVDEAPAELTLGFGYGVPGAADQIFLTVCYCGDQAKSETVLKPLRSLGKPLSDDIRTVPAYVGLTDEEAPSLPNAQGAALVPHLSDANIDALSDAIQGAPALYTLDVFWFGSAVTRGDSAYPFRMPCSQPEYAAFWRDEKDRDAAVKWIERLDAALAPSSKGAYVNTISSPNQAREVFGQNYDRLAAIKKKYDPDNFFHMNQNIKPAA